MAIERGDFIKIHPLDIRGQVIDVFVEPGGMFFAQVEGRGLRSQKLEDLKTQLMTITKRKSVELNIPFSRLSLSRYGGRAEKIKHGTLTKIHAGTGKPMIRWAEGDSEQGQWGYGQGSALWLKPLSKQEGEHYIALVRAQIAAKKAVDDFEEKYAQDMRAKVKEALQAAGASVEGI